MATSNITRHDLAVFLGTLDPADMAESLSAQIHGESGYVSHEDVKAAVSAFERATRTRKATTPSKDTLRNRAITADLVSEINARGAEFTAAELAEFVTDPQGFPMTTKKVSSLLRIAAMNGDIARVSRKNGYHYAPCGFEFAPEVKRTRPEKPIAVDDDSEVEDDTEE